MKEENLTFDEMLDNLEKDLLSKYGDSDENINILKSKFSHFKSEMKRRWLKAHRVEKNFLKQNSSWLEGTFEIPITKQRQGRPSISFEDSSERSKRRKTEDVRSSVDEEVIVHAAAVVLQKSGKRDASKVLKDITNSPTRANEYIKAYSSQDTPPLTPLEALSMLVDADLSRRQYERIRETNKHFFPCYDLVLKAKQECYPPKDLVRVTATCAESNLQSLIDLTVTRLSQYLEDVLMRIKEKDRNSLKVICKWGCDGSQQAQFKQKFLNDADSDANIFMSSFVPLQITCGQDNIRVVWQNPTPSSPRYCRPIRFRFVKETTDVTNEEINYVQDAAKSLKRTTVNLKGQLFSVATIFKMTMVDGKVCNAATGTKSTSRCYICGATSKDFNNLNKKFEINPQALDFGLSVLHARIRIFESILHLAYKLPIKKYRERKTQEEKEVEEKRKFDIQQRFRQETGLLVDIPKTNFGNTNDGNTSRRFFENAELSADITGINYNLIYRLKVILETLSSGHKIDTKKYDEYALNTAKLYIELYGWHPMTPTLHKILVHGSSIIEKSLLPIGQLAEEAAEARNKHFRAYRQDFSRKFSREYCNLDVYNRLILSSDPVLSSMRRIKKSKTKSFLPETLEMLLPGQPNPDDSESGEENND